MIADRYSGQHSTDNPHAVAAFETAVWNVLAHRPDGAKALAAALSHDGNMVAAHALRGFAGVMLARRETVEAAAQDLRNAALALALRRASDGERALVSALEHAVAGRLRKASAILDERASQAPQDLLVLKLAHALHFMCGDARAMRASLERAAPHWVAGMPGYGFLLGCQAFSYEETGDLGGAERIARRAISQEPADAWGLHALGHVMEMQGRTDEGVDLLTQTRANWSRCNNFSFHMAWHLALFHLARGRIDSALDLYDREVRAAPTDDFRDIANAVSLLWRLRQEGVNVGARWDELAEIARRRADDTTLIFASLHHLLTLAAVGDYAHADLIVRNIGACAARGVSDQSDVARSVGLDLARAILSAARGGKERADIARLADSLSPLGGSRAQRDVFIRTLAVMAAQSGERSMVERVLSARMRLQREDRFSAIVFALLAGRAPVSWRAA